MKLTKKAKLEGYDKLAREHDLLERYFWDAHQTLNLTGHALESDWATVEKVAGVVTTDRLKVWAYQLHACHGGYVVIQWNDGVPDLMYVDDWLRVEEPIVGNISCAIATAKQTLRAHRQKVWDRWQENNRLRVAAERAGLEPHASDCAHWVAEPCNCALGRKEE